MLAAAVLRDPARSISLTSNRPVPTGLPSDRVDGLLDRIEDPRERLMVALVAIYAVLPRQLVQLKTTDFDRSKGRLRLRRPGRVDHVVYLDEFTRRLATAWELHRFHRWPDSSNPHLFVNRNTAVDDSGPPISTAAVQWSSSACPPTPPPATSCRPTQTRSRAPSPRSTAAALIANF